MAISIGILGDPAKYEMYSEEFYTLMDHEGKNNIFYLLGASEDIGRKNYLIMYEKLRSLLEHYDISYFDKFCKNPAIHPADSRIGLFPSSAGQLIKGPGFILAPYPGNSRSKYLRLKALVVRNILSPFVGQEVVKLAYFPLGGKAGAKTKANTNSSITELQQLFYEIRKRDKFSHYYLEAGSGQKVVSNDQMQAILSAQHQAINGNKLGDEPVFDHHSVIVPRSIYGGGIKSRQIIRDILYQEGNYFLPESIIIGNVSETNISETYNIVDEIHEFNSSIL